jgi:hypothetical protein
MRNDQNSNLGKVTPLTLVSPVRAAVTTQLIRASYAESRTSSVRIVQATSVRNQTTPWNSSTVDNNTFAVAPPDFNSPAVPVTAGNWNLRCRLQWGVGGAATVAVFDYPLAGGGFALSAQHVSLDVVWYNALSNLYEEPTFATSEDVTVVGAFISDALPSTNRYPMVLGERAGTIAPLTEVAWAVKSHAREVVIANLTEIASTIRVDFKNKNGAVLSTKLMTQLANSQAREVFAVPSQAVVVTVGNLTAGAVTVLCTWQMDFA